MPTHEIIKVDDQSELEIWPDSGGRSFVRWRYSDTHELIDDGIFRRETIDGYRKSGKWDEFCKDLMFVV